MATLALLCISLVCHVTATVAMATWGSRLRNYFRCLHVLPVVMLASAGDDVISTCTAFNRFFPSPQNMTGLGAGWGGGSNPLGSDDIMDRFRDEERQFLFKFVAVLGHKSILTPHAFGRTSANGSCRCQLYKLQPLVRTLHAVVHTQVYTHAHTRTHTHTLMLLLTLLQQSRPWDAIVLFTRTHAHPCT